jgi:hypothetical protein
VICENKKWKLPLDRTSGSSISGTNTPSTQILNYLSNAEIQSNGQIIWAILTSGVAKI